MAERHLIRGIDNTCAAVHEGVRRVKEDGIVHLRCPAEPIRAIDNATAVRHASDRSRSGTAQPVFLIRGIGNGGPVLISTNVLHEEGAEVGEDDCVEKRFRSAAE